MKNLLKFELRKLLTMKSFYICSLLIIISCFLTAISNIPDEETAGIVFADTGEIPAAFQILFSAFLTKPTTVTSYMMFSLSGSQFLLIFSIFAIIFISDDYSKQKTIKNVYSHGFTRTQVFSSKMIVLAIATTAVFAVVYLFNFLMAIIFFPFGSDAFPIGAIPVHLLAVLSYVSFSAFTAFAFKNVIVPIVILVFGPQTVTGILMVFDLILYEEGYYPSMMFWFDNFVSVTSSVRVFEFSVWIVLISSIVYISLFTSLGWLVNRKHSL